MIFYCGVLGVGRGSSAPGSDGRVGMVGVSGVVSSGLMVSGLMVFGISGMIGLMLFGSFEVVLDGGVIDGDSNGRTLVDSWSSLVSGRPVTFGSIIPCMVLFFLTGLLLDVSEVTGLTLETGSMALSRSAFLSF